MKISFLKLSRFCFYLFFAFLPFQIDVVFSVTDLYSSGFFNPYTTQVLYLPEIFLLSSGFFLALNYFFHGKFKFLKKRDLVLVLYIVFLFSVLISCFFAFDFNVSLLYLWRFVEGLFIYILCLTGLFDLKKIIKIFVFVMFLEAVLGIAQFLFQHSLGFSFFGEPLLNLGIKGIASTTIFGEKLLRSYGTFTHPNVFAMFLLFAISFCLFLKLKHKVLLTCVLFTALIFAFSRTGFLAAVLVIMWFLFLKKDSKYLRLGILLLFLVGSLLVLRFVFDSDSALIERLRLFLIASDMFFHNLFGVGAGNFTLVMANYSDLKLLPWNYQPVHNIFVLAFAELGFFGGIALTALLVKVSWSAIKKPSVFIIPLLFIFLSGAFFDHYFLTLFQGQMLFAFFLVLNSYDLNSLA